MTDCIAVNSAELFESLTNYLSVAKCLDAFLEKLQLPICVKMAISLLIRQIINQLIDYQSDTLL